MSKDTAQWHTFKYVYFAPKLTDYIHKNIVDWIRENGYGPKSFSGKYADLYIFATNDENIAMQFKLTWIESIYTEVSKFLKEDSYTYSFSHPRLGSGGFNIRNVE